MTRLLDVLIVTHGSDGLDRVADMTLPQVEGVSYIVSWQNGGKDFHTPAGLNRDDMEIYTTDTVGSSINHNLSILHAKAPLCLIADNDLHYTSAQLRGVIDTFDAYPEIDLAFFKYQGSPKSYPSETTEVTRDHPRNYWVSMIEIAFRLDSVRGKVWFNEDFGLCAKYGCAEDTIFVHDCISAGLKCRFFPFVVTSHPSVSGGSRKIDKKENAAGEGAAIRHIYGFGGILRVPLFAWRTYRKGRFPLFWGLWHVSGGFLTYRRRRLG